MTGATDEATRAVLDGPLRTAVVVAALGPPLVIALGLLAGAPPRPLPAAAIAAAAERVVPGNAYRTLETLQADHPERVIRSAAHRGATAFIASALAAAGGEVRVERITFSHGELVNVLARVPGVDRSARVVLAAHHDTVSGAPGAIDDGGAVAVLIEATRVLAQGPPPPCDVEVAIFDLEEKGLVGSKAHLARQTQESRDAVRAALAVELVGWRKDRLVLHTLPYGFAHTAKGVTPAWLPSTVRAAASDAGVGVGLGDPYVSPWYQATIRGLRVLTGSDADAYLARGIPACLLTGSALTNFYVAYHTPKDDMSMVDGAKLDAAARAVVGASTALCALGPRERELGHVYLALGERTLDARALGALGLALALPAALAVLGLARRRFMVAAGTLGCAAVCLLLLSLGPSLVGLIVVGPLAYGAALGFVLRRARLARACAWVSIVPPLVELLLVIAASAMFGGFTWLGAKPEAAGVLLGGAAALVAATEVDRLRKGQRLTGAAALIEDARLRRAEAPTAPTSPTAPTAPTGDSVPPTSPVGDSSPAEPT